MKQTCPIKQEWRENTFTLNLSDCLQPIAYDQEYPIFVIMRPKQHTAKMRTGEQKPIEAKEMDLILFSSWERNYDTIHFVWEAKRVGDKSINHTYRKLNTEYIHEAIYRFIQNEYAAHVADAGVLAYVLAGDATTIVNDINESMGRVHEDKALDTSNHLQLISFEDKSTEIDFKDYYQSRHMRSESTPICLHHLFLTFDFA